MSGPLQRELGAGIAQGIRCKPLHDARHGQLKAPWDIQTDESATIAPAILEIVRRAARNERIRTPRCMGPRTINDDAHRPLDNVEDMILRVGVGSRTSSIGVKPPLRNGVARIRLRSIRHEDGTHSTHWIRATLTRARISAFLTSGVAELIIYFRVETTRPRGT
jgi:hypothetical protein